MGYQVCGVSDEILFPDPDIRQNVTTFLARLILQVLEMVFHGPSSLVAIF